MKTFEQLVEALILEANSDGHSDAAQYSDALVNLRAEILARAARLTGTGVPLDAQEIADVLDGVA